VEPKTGNRKIERERHKKKRVVVRNTEQSKKQKRSRDRTFLSFHGSIPTELCFSFQDEFMPAKRKRSLTF